MIKSSNICIIGGYDSLSKSFFREIKKKYNSPIFINVNSKTVNFKNVFNINIFQLKQILQLLNHHKIKNIIFLGKISRPNLNEFKNDGEIEKYLPQLFDSFKKGDGYILSTVINIFTENGFKVISPNKVSSNFFFTRNDLNKLDILSDKIDSNKSVKILNDLSKYDNAQSAVCVNGYIIAIEAAEGTDSLLKRTQIIRKKLKQINMKAGLLTKIPKKNQSKLIDLPVIGPKTIHLINRANLNGIVINPKYTMVYEKAKTLKLKDFYNLKIYDATV